METAVEGFGPRWRQQVAGRGGRVALVVRDRIVDGREEPHRFRPVAAHVGQRGLRDGGQVDFHFVGRQRFEQFAEYLGAGRVRVLQPGHVDDQARRHGRGVFADAVADHGHAGDSGRHHVGHGLRHLPFERVPIDHVQAAGVPQDLDARHLLSGAIQVQSHVQVSVRQPAEHVHLVQYALDEHEKQGREHAHQQPRVDVHHDDRQVRYHPHHAVGPRVPPDLGQVEHLEQDALERHHHDAGQHAPRQRLEHHAHP